MCGRYTLHKKTKDILKHYNLANFKFKDIRENYNVAPGQTMPVVTKVEDGLKIEEMKWGLIPVWAKDPSIGYKMINARSETLFEKTTWKRLISKKRCLIPADSFYEWKKLPDGSKTKKQPYLIHPKQVDIFSFAGLWESWKDVEGLEWKTYSIITTKPNKEMSKLHDRAPVMLWNQKDESDWLNPSMQDRGEIESLLQPLKDDVLDMYEVSSDVNSAKTNDKHLIEAIA